MRTTHTYAVLQISQSAYDEIRGKLLAADYGHAVHQDDGKEVIDMHGIAVRATDGGSSDKPNDEQLRELCGKANEMLNRAFAADPNAMHSLACYRVPCNQTLADDPNVVVDQIPVLRTGPHWAVGMIGVIVGMFQAMGFPCTIGSSWSDDKDDEGRRKMQGFGVLEFSRRQPGQPGDRSAVDGAE